MINFSYALSFLMTLLLTCGQLIGFEKIVIWGHKLHSHTHSYIHQGFYQAFKRLDYATYWFDDKDDVSTFDFSNALFITEGRVDKNIPLRNDCLYLVHNPVDAAKYRPLQCAYFQVYTDELLSRPNLIKVDACIYFDLNQKCLYMPWATDLFPEEIDEIKKNMPAVQKEPTVYWVGSMGIGVHGNNNELSLFSKACEEKGIEFKSVNPWGAGVSEEEHRRLISVSYMAPAIVGQWQKEMGYIPCRIFKNISYGQMGVTNSARVFELFEGKVIYNPDAYELFYDAHERLQTLAVEEIYELMEIVKTKHTFLNRTKTMLKFLKAVGYLQ